MAYERWSIQLKQPKNMTLKLPALSMRQASAANGLGPSNYKLVCLHQCVLFYAYSLNDNNFLLIALLKVSNWRKRRNTYTGWTSSDKIMWLATTEFHVANSTIFFDNNRKLQKKNNDKTMFSILISTYKQRNSLLTLSFLQYLVSLVWLLETLGNLRIPSRWNSAIL